MTSIMPTASPTVLEMLERDPSYIWQPSEPSRHSPCHRGSPSSRQQLTRVGRSGRCAGTRQKGKCPSARKAAVNGGTRAQSWRRSSRLWTSTAHRPLHGDVTLPCKRLQLAPSVLRAIWKSATRRRKSVHLEATTAADPSNVSRHPCRRDALRRFRASIEIFL